MIFLINPVVLTVKTSFFVCICWETPYKMIGLSKISVVLTVKISFLSVFMGKTRKDDRFFSKIFSSFIG